MAGQPGFKGEILPVTPGTLYGLRAFDLDVDECLLRGVSFDEAWNGSENVATCHDTIKKSYKHSMQNCDHGYWSYFGVNQTYLTKERVPAVIEGYGEIVVGELGFRAQKARIKAIVTPDIKDRTIHKRKADEQAVQNTQSATRSFIGLALFCVALLAIMLWLGLGSDFLARTPEDWRVLMFLFGVFLVVVTIAWFIFCIDAARLSFSKYRELKERLRMENVEISEMNFTLKQKEFEAKLQEKYPDATLYPSLKEMIHAHSSDILVGSMLTS